jgi:HSP20 family protein
MEDIMNMTRLNPFRDLDNFFGKPRFDWGNDITLQNLNQSDWIPAVDINETEDEFLLTVEVPQVEKDDIKIEVQNGMLNIRGERKYANEDKKARRIERFYGSFQRSFQLPENVDKDDIKARQKDGVLYLNLPKSIKEMPKKQEIRIN